MSHSPGQAAAENIEQFLAEWPEPNHQGVVSRATPNIWLTTHDLRAVLTELAEYKQAVNAILELDGSYGISRQDLLNAAAAHITGLEV